MSVQSESELGNYRHGFEHSSMTAIDGTPRQPRIGKILSPLPETYPRSAPFFLSFPPLSSHVVDKSFNLLP